MERLIVELEEIDCIDDFDSKTSKSQDCIVALMLIVAIKTANKMAENLLRTMLAILQCNTLILIKNWHA
jgi:hypothetical protein